jgi:TM2 domain-containing membrane protein YozV
MKNKMVAGILAILIGGLGVHKFYLGNIMPGVVYLLFCWTGIPSILALIEGIIYLMDTDEAFQARVEAKKFFM